MNFDRQRQNMLKEINEQILSGHKAIDDMKRRASSIIDNEKSLSRRYSENQNEKEQIREELETLIQKEQELYSLEIEAQRKLVEIQSIRNNLEQSIARNLPKHDVLSKRLERTRSGYKSACDEEATQRERLSCQIKEFQRLQNEATKIERIKSSLASGPTESRRG